jgi:hypothetical protein
MLSLLLTGSYSQWRAEGVVWGVQTPPPSEIPNYSCLQNPWLGGHCTQILVLSVICPQLNFLNKIHGYATGYSVPADNLQYP